MKSDTTNSFSDTTTANRTPAKSPGPRSGSVTRRNTRHGVAPRLTAARSSAGSRFRTLTPTERTTNGSTRATWAAMRTLRLRRRPRAAAAEPSALERQRGEGAHGQRERHGPSGDEQAVHRCPLELGIGQDVLVPAQRDPARRKRQDRRRVERHRDHDHGWQGHERHEREDDELQDHDDRPAARRPITVSRASVSASASMAKAAAPGQLKESRPRSRTTLAIIFTRPPPRSSGVGNADSVHANTMRLPDTTPGIDSGSVTRRNTRAGDA